MTRARAAATAAVCGVVAFGWLLALELARWNLGRATSYDLGIFSQAAQSWAGGHLPRSFIRGPHLLLADHFSPVTALFGVAWRIWADPRALLVTQALCLAVAIALPCALAARRIGGWAALVILLVGAAGRTMIAGDLFDVHEVCFAAAFTAVLAWGMLTRRLGPVLAASVLLLTVKEDLGLTVVAAGLLWWWRGRGTGGRRTRWQGAALVLLGLVGLAVALGTIAALNPGGIPYLSYFGGTGHPLAGSSIPPVHGLHAARRVVPLLCFTATCLGLGWRSGITWLAVPTLAWRMASSNPHYWSSAYHYGLDLAPIGLTAAVEAWPLVAGWARGSGTARGLTAALAAVCGIGSLAGGALSLARQQIDPRAAVSASPLVRELREVSRRLPAGAAVAAQNNLGPYLVSRQRVTMLGHGRPERVRYAVFTTVGASQFQAAPCQRAAYLRLARTQPGWRLTGIGQVHVLRFPATRPAALPSCPPSVAADH